MASSSRGEKSSRRHRERIVGSSRPGAWLTRKKSVFGRRLLEHLEQRVGAAEGSRSSSVSMITPATAT